MPGASHYTSGEWRGLTRSAHSSGVGRPVRRTVSSGWERGSSRFLTERGPKVLAGILGGLMITSQKIGKALASRKALRKPRAATCSTERKFGKGRQLVLASLEGSLGTEKRLTRGQSND